MPLTLAKRRRISASSLGQSIAGMEITLRWEGMTADLAAAWAPPKSLGQQLVQEVPAEEDVFAVMGTLETLYLIQSQAMGFI